MIIVEDIRIDTRKIKDAYWTLKILTLPVPRKIVEILQSYPGGRNVTQLFILLRMDQSACSQNLALLRRYNIVFSERKGKQIIYKLNQDKLLKINNALNKFFENESLDTSAWISSVA